VKVLPIPGAASRLEAVVNFLKHLGLHIPADGAADGAAPAPNPTTNATTNSTPQP